MPFPKDRLRPTYSSEDMSLLDDFYLPFLSVAKQYDRAVGYFSAHMLTYALQGVVDFANRDGKMRLIIGWPVTDEEYQAINEDDLSTSETSALKEEINKALHSESTELAKFRLNLLSWMVRSETLSIRMVIKRSGMYHEKIGILIDEEETTIVFQGSANETENALNPDRNLESISVYPSWKQEVFSDYGSKYQDRFERLWSNTAKNSKTIDLPSECYEAIRNHYPSDAFPVGRLLELGEVVDKLDDGNDGPCLPLFIGEQEYNLNPHQQAAIESWIAANQRGIFALATGAGKTIVALHAAVRVYEARKRKNLKTCIVITVPYQVLAEQWEEVAHLFGFQALLCYRSRNTWLTRLQNIVSDLKLGITDVISLIVVEKTLRSDEFQKGIRAINSESILFIGDECHHHHSMIGSLPKALMRIGLSATPWSRREQERKDFLTSYYGPIVASYTIDQALADGVLTPYDYQIHTNDMTGEETEEFILLQKDIDKMVAIKANGGVINEEALGARYSARSRLLGSVESKFTQLSTVVNNSERSAQNLFYCGDGSVETDQRDEPIRDIQRVTKTLYDAGWRVSKFTAGETQRERRQILNDFSSHEIDAMVAIRVLDEGIDLPNCHQAFLIASSRNERQYIQRRGRVLRLAKNKTKAIIHDFIVLPAPGYTSNECIKLVQEELRRAHEFLRIAENRVRLSRVADNLAKTWGVDYDQIITESNTFREEELDG